MDIMLKEIYLHIYKHVYNNIFNCVNIKISNKANK